MARAPAVAGQFYNGTREGLIREIEGCFTGRLGPGRLPAPSIRPTDRAYSGLTGDEGLADPSIRPAERAYSGSAVDGELTGHERARQVMGLVCPHAGYVYSGAAAAWAYDALAADGVPDTAVILGPNHYGLGPPAALSPEDEWATPLGTLRADAEIAEAILRLSKYCEPDELAHAREHSIEVQLPFIQYLAGDAVQIVPISISHLSKDDALALVDDLGNAIAEAVRGKNAVIVASSDFTHYESKAAATAKDSLAIERIVNLDARGLIEVVYSRNITMCGVIGTAVMIDACARLGATSARKLTYYTSGDVTGDIDQVVGYAAISVGAESSSA